ncbi:hypothetical protein OH76DRAFT_1199659 [Lentinus brumalis]|uniref:Uncharacterized protein n=1 Tax=Lentinus brumalis TaxID=2498619 RepID=A0A371CT41_9APHY|nr:hypothetical protein OH76DRAFT_1199659 [Polyporus brumalis]
MRRTRRGEPKGGRSDGGGEGAGEAIGRRQDRRAYWQRDGAEGVYRVGRRGIGKGRNGAGGEAGKAERRERQVTGSAGSDGARRQDRRAYWQQDGVEEVDGGEDREEGAYIQGRARCPRIEATPSGGDIPSGGGGLLWAIVRPRRAQTYRLWGISSGGGRFIRRPRGMVQSPDFHQRMSLTSRTCSLR